MKRSPANESALTAAKRICDRCVGETFLKGIIRASSVETECSYCENESKTFSIEQLADLIEKAFEDHYERTPTEPEGYEAYLHNDSESDYMWERHGEEVLWAIANAADIHEHAASDVLSALEDRHSDFEKAKMGEECPFARSSYYEVKGVGYKEFSMKWGEFVRGLKTEARFFSRSAQAILDEIFADLFTLKTSKGSPVVATVGPDAEIKFLHRARIFAGEDAKLQEALEYPWKHLGPPPMIAASAGRMNARGISVFYGAIDSATALAEVRPPVGSKVAVAKFTIERPLRLLDVEALKSVAILGSIFDPKHIRQLQRANFLEILSHRISRAVMPSEEAFEYLPTQAVAEYLATEAKLDGIIFPSVQFGHASSNVVLFHHASRVSDIQLPKGTEINASLEQYDEDGATPEYRVLELLPPATAVAKPTDPGPDSLDFLYTPPTRESLDRRPPSLKIDLPSITVHHIKKVQFSSEEFPVNRDRFTKPNMEAF